MKWMEGRFFAAFHGFAHRVLCFGLQNRNFAWRFLLQQEFGCFDDRIRMEPLAHTTFKHHIVDRHDRHAVMVRHVIADNGIFFVFADARLGEVDGIIETILSKRTQRAQPFQVLDRLGRLILARHDACIRRNNVILRQSTLEAQE